MKNSRRARKKLSKMREQERLAQKQLNSDNQADSLENVVGEEVSKKPLFGGIIGGTKVGRTLATGGVALYGLLGMATGQTAEMPKSEFDVHLEAMVNKVNTMPAARALREKMGRVPYGASAKLGTQEAQYLTRVLMALNANLKKAENGNYTEAQKQAIAKDALATYLALNLPQERNMGLQMLKQHQEKGLLKAIYSMAPELRHLAPAQLREKLGLNLPAATALPAPDANSAEMKKLKAQLRALEAAERRRQLEAARKKALAEGRRQGQKEQEIEAGVGKYTPPKQVDPNTLSKPHKSRAQLIRERHALQKKLLMAKMINKQGAEKKAVVSKALRRMIKAIAQPEPTVAPRGPALAYAGDKLDLHAMLETAYRSRHFDKKGASYTVLASLSVNPSVPQHWRYDERVLEPNSAKALQMADNVLALYAKDPKWFDGRRNMTELRKRCQEIQATKKVSNRQLYDVIKLIVESQKNCRRFLRSQSTKRAIGTGATIYTIIKSGGGGGNGGGGSGPAYIPPGGSGL